MKPCIVVRPFTAAWWWNWQRQVKAGRRVEFMVAEAKRGRPLTLRRSDAPTDADLASLVPVLAASPGFVAWQRFWRERHGVAMPRPDFARVVFMPSKEPQAVDWIDGDDGQAAVGWS